MNRECTVIDTLSSCWARAILLLILLTAVPQAKSQQQATLSGIISDPSGAVILDAANFNLALYDYPELDPHWRTTVPRLIKWTEDNFVFRGAPGEPGTQWGANIVGEQDSFLFKMDYQTARYAAQCARWYAVSHDEAYKEKAYRSLNWVTYCNSPDGQGNESPLSKNISNWWSDLYGECPRMFYQAFAGVPEWAPSGQDHILYSETVLKDVSYGAKNVQYTATQKTGTDYLRLTFRPNHITLAGARLSLVSDPGARGTP
jgi:hypothetical protein